MDEDLNDAIYALGELYLRHRRVVQERDTLRVQRDALEGRVQELEQEAAGNDDH